MFLPQLPLTCVSHHSLSQQHLCQLLSSHQHAAAAVFFHNVAGSSVLLPTAIPSCRYDIHHHWADLFVLQGILSEPIKAEDSMWNLCK